MEDNKKGSSWDNLLQDLGARPDESAYERHQPKSQDLPAEEMPSGETRADGAPRAADLSGAADDAAKSQPAASSDWNNLAESLGIDVQEPVPSKPVVTSSSTPDVALPVAQQAANEDTDEAADQAAGISAAAEPFGGSLGSADADTGHSRAGKARAGKARAGKARAGKTPAGKARAGKEPAGDRTQADDDLSDDDFGVVDKSRDDDADDDSTSDFAAQSGDELPPLPSEMDQVMSDTAWADDRDEQRHVADGESGEATTDESDNAGISGEAARSAFDALFADGASGWGSAFLDRPKPVDEQGSLVNSGEGQGSRESEGTLESASLESATGRLGGDEPGVDEESEKPKRKRSRRRRRGGKGRRPAADQGTGEASGEEPAEHAEAGATGTQADAMGSPDEADEADEASAGEPTKRPRRSRSRRGTRPVESKESGARSAEVKDNRVRGELDDDDDDDDDDMDDDLDSELADDDLGENSPRDAARGRKRHSNLPTWSDAIGMIVDGNLEQRAKSPSKPQSSRGRGGRGGGRRRGSKRPESK